MDLRQSYTLLAPVYDPIVARATRQWRRDSLHVLGEARGRNILIDGIGSGLDIPYLSPHAQYIGLDLTWAMLQRARTRASQENIEMALYQGNAMALPYADEAFDAVVMHLILAVVPQPPQALSEAARVLKPRGRILILDKFLRPGQRAPLRRIISPLLGRIATRTDVVFEEALIKCPQLTLASDVALAGNWFRHIVLQKV